MIDDVSMCLHSGEFVGLIGPNGAGKTTLLRVMLGLMKPHKGEVRREATRIGYIPQRGSVGTQQVPVSTLEVVRMGAPSASLALAALDRLELSTHASKRYDELSGGQQQRVLIAKALAGSPELLVLDEPTTGIDDASQRDFFRVLEGLSASGITIVMVSHDIEAVVKQVSRVVCLNHRVLYDGEPRYFETERYMPQMYGAPHRALHHQHDAKPEAGHA